MRRKSKRGKEDVVSNYIASERPRTPVIMDGKHEFLTGVSKKYTKDELRAYHQIARVWVNWFNKTGIVYEVQTDHQDIIQIYTHLVHGTAFGSKWCCEEGNGT